MRGVKPSRSGTPGECDAAAAEPLLGSGEGGADGGRAPGKDASREPRPHVLLMQDVRNPAHSSRRHRGGHHVAAHAEHHIGPEAIDDAESGAQRGRYDHGQGDVLPEGVAVEPADVHRRELEARGGHELLLRAAAASDQEHRAVRLLGAKRSGDRERRIQVPSGPAASDQKPHLSSRVKILCHFERC